MLYFDGDVGLVIRNGRDPRLAPAMEAAMVQFTRGAEVTLRLNVGFAPIFGPEARRIAMTRHNRSAGHAWLRQGLRSGVFTGQLRGVAGVVVDRNGARPVSIEKVGGLSSLLDAAGHALNSLKSRSNRGQLVGPYWYRGLGTDLHRTLPRPEAPSALNALFVD
jgi:hypothetical protein